MTAELRPLAHLADLSARYPGAWGHFEQMRVDRGKGLPDWPEWCFVPVAGAYAVVSGGGENRLSLTDLGPVLDVGALAALAAWRMTKGVYRFDEDVLAALWDTPLTGELPSELLLRLPEWCVYIETPGRTVMGALLHGFYAHLEQDMDDGHRELRLVLDFWNGLSPIPIHLMGTLAEGLEQMTREAELQAALQGQDINVLRSSYNHHDGATWSHEVAPLVSLVLYLCSERPDITGKGEPGNPQPKRVKGGERLFAAPGVREWGVAYRLGAAFRQARAETSGHGTGEGGRNVRPHFRKSHFHTFLSGPRSGPQTRTLRWLPPIAVMFDPRDDELPAVVRRVRAES